MYYINKLEREFWLDSTLNITGFILLNQLKKFIAPQLSFKAKIIENIALNFIIHLSNNVYSNNVRYDLWKKICVVELIAILGTVYSKNIKFFLEFQTFPAGYALILMICLIAEKIFKKHPDIEQWENFIQTASLSYLNEEGISDVFRNLRLRLLSIQLRAKFPRQLEKLSTLVSWISPTNLPLSKLSCNYEMFDKLKEQFPNATSEELKKIFQNGWLKHPLSSYEAAKFLLEVDQIETKSDIDKHWKKLGLICHPDKNPKAEEDLFKIITQAKIVLYRVHKFD